VGSALDQLIAHYRDRSRVAEEVHRAGGFVVGYVGADVPVELITAAGALPERLHGDPSADTAVGDRYLGRGLDPATRSVLSRLLGGGYGHLDALILSRDCEASLRLFYAVRELRRIDPGTSLPPVHLIDLLHLPHRTTTRYNLARLQQLRDQLREWTGRPVGDREVAGAVDEQNRTRALLAEVAELRRGVRVRLTGTQALAVVGAGTVLAASHYQELLRQLLDQADGLPIVSGARTFLTGSSHDNGDVYAALEAAGLLIVGEDHDWGDLLFDHPVTEPTLLGLAERYQYNGPSAQRGSIAERAAHTATAAARCRAELLVSYVRDLDEGPPWDFPAQRAAVEALGVRSLLIGRQPYGSVDVQRIPSPIGASR
jgi:benzoyl-CoA reductase/2-hydroxyglutaryl-CoA dehydratase subunit BcrC/BadD/HgdB